MLGGKRKKMTVKMTQRIANTLMTYPKTPSRKRRRGKPGTSRMLRPRHSRIATVMGTCQHCVALASASNGGPYVLGGRQRDILGMPYDMFRKTTEDVRMALSALVEPM